MIGVDFEFLVLEHSPGGVVALWLDFPESSLPFLEIAGESASVIFDGGHGVESVISRIRCSETNREVILLEIAVYFRLEHVGTAKFKRHFLKSLTLWRDVAKVYNTQVFKVK